jgi:hypothetical protein
MELLMCGSISIVQAGILVKRDIDGVGTHSVFFCCVLTGFALNS